MSDGACANCGSPEGFWTYFKAQTNEPYGPKFCLPCFSRITVAVTSGPDPYVDVREVNHKIRRIPFEESSQ